MEAIRKYFKQYVPLSDEDWAIFVTRLEQVTVPRRGTILKQGQTENYLSFIEEGMVRLYIPKEENDLTFAFVFANDFVSGYDSFITRKPCAYQIEALVETTLWRVSWQDLQEIYRLSQAGQSIGRYAAEAIFLKKSVRELSLLHDTAEERYLRLLDEQPGLIREIPLKYIASYIGITPQALSRIRRRIS